MKFFSTPVLFPLAVGLATFPPAARAVDYNPATTITVYIHGFDDEGYNRVGVFGDDSTHNDVLPTLNQAAAVLGVPTWQTDPTAPNVLVGALYYGNTPPAWYTAEDIAADNALAHTRVPRYALRMARYIRHCLNRAPGARSVHVIGASFGAEISRYLLEHNLLNLCSDGRISRWSTVVGVVRGNWAAGNATVNLLAQIFGGDVVNNPDIPEMRYSWVDANISPRNTMNSPWFGPMIITHFVATDDGDGYITALNNNANDGVCMVTDQQFGGFTTPAALHPATDGTLQMPAVAYQPNFHHLIGNNTGMWAGLAAVAQNHQRVTIQLSRLRAIVSGDGSGRGEWVYSVRVFSPRSTVLYGNTLPLQDLVYSDGVSPKFSLNAGQTIHPNSALFDQIIPPGEIRLEVTLTFYELDNFPKFYEVWELGSTTTMGTFTVTVSATNDSTVTVTNGNLEADLTTTIRSVYCVTTLTCPPDITTTTDPGRCGAEVNLGASLATNSNCAILTVTNNAPATFPVGVTPVTWTAVDTSGNTATCVQTVTVVPPALGITLHGGMLTITWNCGVLQEADNVLGPYTDVAGATSPYIPAPPATQKFYRLRSGTP